MSREWTAEPALRAEVTRYYDLALETYRRNPLLLREHVGHEESIRTGGYSTRTLQELVQNAADATRTQVGGGRIEVVLADNTLFCANDGEPFSAAGVRALTHAFLSEKRGDEIGRFGLGFKSTLAMTNAPQIFSRSVSFGFGGSTAKRELQAIAGPGATVPVLRTAALIEPDIERRADPVLDRLLGWATTVVRLPGVQRESLEELKRQMRAFKPEFLLFADGVSELTIECEGEPTRVLSKRVAESGFVELLDGSTSCGNWIVASEMHQPSRTALRQVGAAVAREEIKITVAIPEKQSTMRVGEFWAYFPLEEESTTASGIFNAPWSLNDDRTTLINNDYNREILVAVSSVFARAVLDLATAEDPARHFDYLTARGRESRGFGDLLLTQHIPTSAAALPSIPDADGVLQLPLDLRPLNFETMSRDLPLLGSPDIQQAWQEALTTGNDVPHFRCFSDATRKNRLQRLFAEAHLAQSGVVLSDVLRESQVQEHAAAVPSRRLSEWLGEWSSGSVTDAAHALKTALGLRNAESVSLARTLPLVPTNDGSAALADAPMVFLERVEDLDIEGARFVSPEFLHAPGIKKLLQDAGFRRLDASSILLARLEQLSDDPTPEEWEIIWDAMVDLPAQGAFAILRKSARQIKVPTVDGGWAWPKDVLDVDHTLGADLEYRTLDRQRCIASVATQIGVRNSIGDRAFDFSREPCAEEYRAWVANYLNERRHPDQAPIRSVEFIAEPAVGPASVLVLLERNNAPLPMRADWTEALLQTEFAEHWEIENTETGDFYKAPSFQTWAVMSSGLAESMTGLAPVEDLLAHQMFKFAQLFPVAHSKPKSLKLPAAVQEIPSHLLQRFLEAPERAASLDDGTLIELIEAAVASSSPSPARLPARVGKTVESHPAAGITITDSDDDTEIVRVRQLPYLRVSSDAQVEAFSRLGAVPFAQGFSFSIETSGRGAEDAVFDTFTGLRGQGFEAVLNDARIVRVETLSKRIEAASGVSDTEHPALLDGKVLYAKAELSDTQVLRFVNELFNLGLSAAELRQTQATTLNNQLIEYQVQSRGARTDSDRLNILFAPAELRDSLPSGLWRGLVADGSVDSSTDVAQLLLQVWGFETLKRLSAKFERLGFRNVPSTWAGSTNTIDWVRKFGFDERFAGERTRSLEDMFVVPGAVELLDMHDYQQDLSRQLASVLTLRDRDGKAQKAMLELPTGAGKTRVAAETALRLLRDRAIKGTVLWIAQSQELCEQAVQTFNDIWRGLRVPEALTIGRLWENHEVTRPQTELSVVVAVDAKLDRIIEDRPEEYEWLSHASAVFVDEGHRAGDSPRYTRILTWLGTDGRHWERPLVGLSATPFRGRSEESTLALVRRFGSTKLTAFEDDAYQPLVERGVLAKVKHEILDGASVSLGAEDQKEIAGWNRFSSDVLSKIASDQQRLTRLIDHIMSLDRSWPVLVFTPTVLSAQGLAARLKIRGLKAESISGETGTKERRRIVDRFKSGETRVLVNCDLLTAGFDAPQVRALYVAKPTLSPNAYIQMVGRGLRGPKNGGKEECLIVDLRDNFDGLSDGSLAYTEFDYLWEERR